MKKIIKNLLLGLITILAVINYTEVFTQETDEERFPGSSKYVGDLNKRGNVKNATEAFDLLLGWRDEIKDSVVSTSFLKEKGKPDDSYAPWRANDNDKKTAWVEGVKGDGIGEKIYIKIQSTDVERFKPWTVNFNIINGCAASEALFKSNTRVKKAKLTIYEARHTLGTDIDIRTSDLVINTHKIIDLPDTSIAQNIQMKIPAIKSVKKIDDNNRYDFYLFMAELEILEVYKGTKYSDTCISEFNVKDVIEGK